MRLMKIQNTLRFSLDFFILVFLFSVLTVSCGPLPPPGPLSDVYTIATPTLVYINIPIIHVCISLLLYCYYSNQVPINQLTSHLFIISGSFRIDCDIY